MDYHALAEKLVDYHIFLRLAPLSRKLSVLDKGTFLALHYLEAHQRMAHPKELSGNMAVSSARVAALVNHMERDGLVVRRPDPHDNRQILVMLTNQGEQLIKNKRAEVVESMTEVLEELEPEEVETYLRIQEKILQKFMRRT